MNESARDVSPDLKIRGIARGKIVKCKHCQAKVMLHRRARGTYIPVGPEMILVDESTAGKPIVTPEGETVQGRPGDVGYVPHYLKCKGEKGR